MGHTGIGPKEAGIYSDSVAMLLSGKSPEQVKDFIMSQRDFVRDSYSKSSVSEILAGTKLRGAKFGLVYGISSELTRGQFESYLRGLISKKDDAYCLVTPSDFEIDSINDPELKSKVHLISYGQTLPDRIDPNKIYIVKLKTLPHALFVGLLAYSMKLGLVPIGAEDGFMSAAIHLGGPFVLTRVLWNEGNIKTYKTLLKIEFRKLYFPEFIDNSGFDQALEGVFGEIDLSKARSLRAWPEVFESVRYKIPDLFEQLLKAALIVLRGPKERSLDYTDIENLSDLTFLSSYVSGGQRGEMPRVFEGIDLDEDAVPHIIEISQKIKLNSSGGFKPEIYKLSNGNKLLGGH
jgi:hypothetical protein